MDEPPPMAGWRGFVRKYAELLISVISLCGLLCSSVALSSQDWLVLKDANTPPPPLLAAGNVNVFDLEATYFATSFGLWLACLEKYDDSYGLTQGSGLPNSTCTYINGNCEASVLLKVNGSNIELSSSVAYYNNDCDALMVVRAFGYLHAVLTLIGTTMQWGHPVFERSFLWGSTVLMVAFLLCAVCIGVWFGEIYNHGNQEVPTMDGSRITLNTYYETGWGMILLAVADLLIMVAAIGGMLFASNQAVEVFDSVRHNNFRTTPVTRPNDFRTSPIADRDLRRINTPTSYSFNTGQATTTQARTPVAVSQSGLSQRVHATHAHGAYR